MNTLAGELRQKLGQSKVKDDEPALVTYAFDSSIAPFSKPSLVVLPESTEDVRQLLIAANRERMPVTVMSGGVNIGGQSVPSAGGILLDFRNMNKVLEIDTDAGYAVIEPGVTFDAFTAALHEKGFRCHIPTSPGGSTPLGNALLNPSGSLSNRQLDALLSVEAVLPDGTVVKTGSEAFPSPAAKSYRRYGPFPDLTGLFCCAYGTLGIITRASVRIYPINESTKLHLAAFDNFESAVKFVKDVVNNNIPESCIIWSWQFYKTYDISYPTFANPDVPKELFTDPRTPPKGIPYNIVTSFLSGYREMTEAADRMCGKVAKKYGGKAVSKVEMEQISPGAVRAWRDFYLEYHHPKMEHNKKYGLGRYMALLINAEPKDTIEVEKWVMKEMHDLGVEPVCYYSQPFDFGRYMMFRTFAYFNPQDQKLLEKVSGTFKRLYDATLEKYGATPERYRRDPSMLKNLGATVNC